MAAKKPKTPEQLAARRAWARQHQEKNPGIFRNRMLKHRYGISLNQYNEMFEQRQGLCDICHKPETITLNGKSIPLAVDHCHATGKIRGLLCGACNFILGKAHDDVEVLQAAATYLLKFHGVEQS